MLYFRKTGLGIWRVSANGGEEEEVTALAEGESDHAWLDALPNGRGILFTRDIGSVNEDEIAVLSLETGEIRVLLQGVRARYAHSGHIVYVSGEGTLLAVPFDMDRLEVTGPSRSLMEAIGDFALSETGSLIYLPGSGAGVGGGVPVWMDGDDSEQLLDPALPGLFETPAFSPDGRRVALQRQIGGEAEDIWIYDLDQETLTRLTFEGRNLQPFWNPDGTEVGFSSNRDGNFALYSRSADLSGGARLLASNPNDDGLFEASWTPDGRWLVFRWGSIGTPGVDLGYAPPNPDSTPVLISGTPAIEANPSLSPDGRWLAYVSDESGQYEVYVRPFPGPGGQSLVSVNGGQNPKWALGGKEIYYLGLDGTFNLATVRTDPDFGVESRERLDSQAGYFAANMRHWDLTPDDQRLLAVDDASAVSQQIVVVQNFFEELRELTGN